MASSSKSKKIYDVFLSFRGAELRNNFVSHLYQALHRIGIYTFLDSEELKKGDEILMLMKAIEESRIAIIVFSKDYTSSKWCLKEVAKIMECKEQNNLTVLPVFYKVEPREVRGGKESYERALTEHESKFGKDSEEVKIWKKVLSEARSLSGWHLKDENESELIQRIVKEISIRLNQTPLHVAKHPTGIDSQVAKLKLMLHLESNDDVVMVGLWGQGGIGKSTLARALYNAIFRQFEGSCLLANVREAQNFKDLISLQETLLLEILSLQQKLEVSSVERGINLIQRRLSHKKVLLILDDVDDLSQLNALAGEDKWFGNGSRIIVTTRDNRLLTYLGIDQDHVYEVRELNNNDARELFSKHAFPTHQDSGIRTDLVDSVLNHAKGLPLALEVLGSFLRGRTEYEWESALDDISTTPKKEINDLLKISYNGLEPREQEIFLHIACFFKGRDSEYVKKVLDSCDLKAVIGLNILMERSLIRSEQGKLQMHDLIQLMGMNIVNQQNDDPRRRSRLWRYDDVVDVLSSDMENSAVIAILLKPPEPTEMCITPDAFMKMRRLRLLIFCNIHDFFQGPICLPNGLTWFEWTGCASQIPEFSSVPKKLVGLNMRDVNITGVIKQFKEFQYLKYLNFSHCKSLVRTPDLSCTPNLEEFDLHNCINLVEAHESVTNHDNLQVLNLSNCYELSIFPNVLKSKNLQNLNLKKCRKFERFPDIPHKLEGLKELHLGETAIKGLPASIENLVSLRKMDLNFCKNLVNLPCSIYKLQNLRILLVECCTNLIGFPKYEDLADPCMETGLPNLRWLDLCESNLSEIEFLENLSCFPLLRTLTLSENHITSLPTSINKRDHLVELNIEDCHQLQEIPKLPLSLSCLVADNSESLQKNGHLTLIHHFVRRGVLNMAEISPVDQVRPMADISPIDQVSPHFDIFLIGGEMPKWVLPIRESSLSFKASKDIYDKFLGLAFCFVVTCESHKFPEFEILPHVDGERRDCKVEKDTLYKSSYYIWLHYMIPYDLWGKVDFGPIDENYVHFSLTVSTTNVKKWGCKIICKPLEDDLKADLRDNQLMDPALLHEVVLESTDSETKSSCMHEDSSSVADRQEVWQDCRRCTEEHSQPIPKRNHELILSRGMGTKTVLTSNSTGRDEHGGVGLQLLLLE